MNILGKKIIKIIATILVITFVAQDVVWANPEIFDGHAQRLALQVPSGFKPIADPQYGHEFLLKANALGLIKTFGSVDKVPGHLCLTVQDDTRLDFNFDKKRPGENGAIVIPCVISHEETSQEHNLVIKPEDIEKTFIEPSPVVSQTVQTSQPPESKIHVTPPEPKPTTRPAFSLIVTAASHTLASYLAFTIIRGLWWQLVITAYIIAAAVAI